jgi:branched-chain amino acid transport system substrate-binding protein
VALVTSLTGVAGPEFQDTPKGFLARIALQNAEGGVDGHKLNPVVIDDAGNISQETTTMEDAVQTKGAFGIVSVTPFMFAGYRYLQQKGVPVTGGSFDGPEWGQQPNTNMFAADTGSINPNYPANSGVGTFMKQHGGTSAASVGYGISPSSAQAAKNFASAAKQAGLTAPYVNTSVPFGGVDFTATSLAIKQSGANTVYGSMDNNSNFALAQALKNEGANTKIVTFPTGLEPDIINSPSWQTVQGVYFSDGFVPTQLNTPGTTAFQDALQKYSGMAKSDFPTFNIYEGWLGADLFIKGLQLAGPNPTRSAFISKLRGLTSYNGGGLLPQSYNYATIFGHDAPQTCSYYLQAQATNFKLVSNTPICGSDIPGTGKKA